MKEDYDGAEPAPTSVSAMNLLTLAHLTGESRYADRAAEAIASFGGRLDEMGRAVPFMAAVLSASLASSPNRSSSLATAMRQHTQALWLAANRKFRPFAVIALGEPGDARRHRRAHAVDEDMKMIDGKATVYVCRGFACDAPSTDPAVLA